MNVRNENYRDVVEQVFAVAPFINNLGLDLREFGPGYCETELDVAEMHLQQNRVIHAGVLSTMADHSAGAAASTLVAEDEYLLTVEFKINFLRAAAGDRLFCRADVLKPGRTITVVESSVYVMNGDSSSLVAKGTFTMSILKK